MVRESHYLRSLNNRIIMVPTLLSMVAIMMGVGLVFSLTRHFMSANIHLSEDVIRHFTLFGRWGFLQLILVFVGCYAGSQCLSKNLEHIGTLIPWIIMGILILINFMMVFRCIAACFYQPMLIAI